MKYKLTHTFSSLNFVLAITGTFMVWHITHNGWAVFWAIISALHFSYTPPVQGKKGKTNVK
jgi:hypothetical protein